MVHVAGCILIWGMKESLVGSVLRGMTNYPVIWGWYHKPWHKDPKIKEPGSNGKWKVRVFSSWGWYNVKHVASMYGIYLYIAYSINVHLTIHGCVIFAPCLFDVFGKDFEALRGLEVVFSCFSSLSWVGERSTKTRQKRAPLGAWFPPLSTYTVGITHFFKPWSSAMKGSGFFLQFGDDFNHHISPWVINRIFPMRWSSKQGCTTWCFVSP